MNSFLSGLGLGVFIAMVYLCIMGWFYMARDGYRWVVSDHRILMGYDQHGTYWKNEITGRMSTNTTHHQQH